MKDELKKIQVRTTQYWFSDGLYELAFGALCLLLAMYLLAQALLPQGTWIYNILVISFVLVMLGSGFLLTRLMNALKARFTYPRTGYIAYQSKPRRTRLTSALLGMCIASIMSFLVVRELISVSMLPVITGLVFAFVMLFVGLRSGLLRFPLIGFIALLIGSFLSVVGIGDNLGLSIFYGSIGVVFGLSGACTLRSYLHSTSSPEESEHGE